VSCALTGLLGPCWTEWLPVPCDALVGWWSWVVEGKPTPSSFIALQRGAHIQVSLSWLGAAKNRPGHKAH
jgi:hypothetical protein